ncbi:hypothetical protein ABEG91_19615 [Pantoea agglomerans]|jgi:hypothetical protein|uniref:hypothetical protein n=1 Tax=Enterobacter agglomerans TaxID=549 RepID=UPI0010BFD034|nr:hypothetical protein [Pantoea agglomerans]MDF9912614.1 hypothetical protein [Pantoea brenneri]MBD8144696.1 hypothetical protein [Pantoea agglomerans]MBD8183465.1 hypothetical protein [Pantoea agglomerans]MBD8222552.1 hypothetical protein [Pantoea agglomerans]TKJ56425.1 hypothetical protein PagCFBP13505_12035 [Pantoea agglomerans]
MIDFKTMFEREKIREIVLFLVGRNENGISHPQLDGICTTYGGNHISNIELIHLVKDMQYKTEIQSNGKGGYKKSRYWQEPKFVTEKKYGIK